MKRTSSKVTLDAVAELYDQLSDVSTWRTNSRGNYTRSYNGNRLTCFRQWGEWRWVIAPVEADEGEPQFASHGYDTVEDAIVGCASECLSDVLG